MVNTDKQSKRVESIRRWRLVFEYGMYISATVTWLLGVFILLGWLPASLVTIAYGGVSVLAITATVNCVLYAWYIKLKKEAFDVVDEEL